MDVQTHRLEDKPLIEPLLEPEISVAHDSLKQLRHRAVYLLAPPTTCNHISVTLRQDAVRAMLTALKKVNCTAYCTLHAHVCLKG